ncbi:exopolyphosphatase [Heliophilum fasciatum]|uniref:NanoRNase/pAp phosphatase (C-di-AMP/oligoRNAs hydrolase) n=1 Tax=Heliophilum fasciatum TaxID=35700 RepID=A0A4V2SWL1_9FIRM|nr:exopolyphosphatase [Heliophilum fasciatum]MCW2278683.1 nanoRNase/pAp phosphatase (c-di-AMP/oligoRNAs hydrolase) [Heliophilum fasciatum]TCP62596.1 nanoRNase/pAp phosphatase (c-di-AMP/oligoRNAs hydrolase) [Heliophilum fasciatum]
MRLLTRSDFDGLACAVLFEELGMVHERKFVHPKDLQDGVVEVTADDILANVPYVPGCGLWFDHHASEEERGSLQNQCAGCSRQAPSAARVIYDYYGGAERFPQHLNDLMAAVDKSDSAAFTIDEVLHPQGWPLLSFIMDPRTGLGRFRDYRISNYQLMDALIGYCRTLTIDEILALPDVQERVKRYYEQDRLFREMVAKHTQLHGNVIVTDLRNVDLIYSGNRFMIYAMYPEQNISIWVVDGRNKQNCVFACGHSVFNRTSTTNVGSLMLKYGGGGHPKVGTCQVPYAEADQVLQVLIEQMKQD